MKNKGDSYRDRVARLSLRPCSISDAWRSDTKHEGLNQRTPQRSELTSREAQSSPGNKRCDSLRLPLLHRFASSDRLVSLVLEWPVYPRAGKGKENDPHPIGSSLYRSISLCGPGARRSCCCRTRCWTNESVFISIGHLAENHQRKRLEIRSEKLSLGFPLLVLRTNEQQRERSALLTRISRASNGRTTKERICLPPAVYSLLARWLSHCSSSSRITCHHGCSTVRSKLRRLPSLLWRSG